MISSPWFLITEVTGEVVFTICLGWNVTRTPFSKFSVERSSLPVGCSSLEICATPCLSYLRGSMWTQETQWWVLPQVLGSLGRSLYSTNLSESSYDCFSPRLCYASYDCIILVVIVRSWEKFHLAQNWKLEFYPFLLGVLLIIK